MAEKIISNKDNDDYHSFHILEMKLGSDYSSEIYDNYQNSSVADYGKEYVYDHKERRWYNSKPIKARVYKNNKLVLEEKL